MQTRLPPSDIQEEDMTMMHIHRAPHPHCFNSSSIEMHQPIMNASQQHPSLGIDYPLKEIMSPHANDVLCGRGGGSNNHPGNESFRELVNEVKLPYVNCPNREKPLIARRIVEAVRNQTPPGRFLSKDTKSGLWNDIGDGKAREKTSQALREGASIIRDMIGKPSSPMNVANALKEAKKAERAEKEYHVRLPKNKRSLSLSSKHSKRDMEEEAFERFSEDHDAQPQVVHDAGYSQQNMFCGSSSSVYGNTSGDTITDKMRNMADIPRHGRKPRMSSGNTSGDTITDKMQNMADIPRHGRKPRMSSGKGQDAPQSSKSEPKKLNINILQNSTIESSSPMYFDFHQPSLGGFSVLSPQDEAVRSKMKKMLNMQQAKLNHLSSKLGQSNGNSELQTTQDNQPSSSLSQSEVSFPSRQQRNLFPEKLYHMLELADAQAFGLSSNAVSWLPSGRAFTVRDEKVFMEAIVPLFFKQTKIRSFGKQLNLWGFKRLNDDAYTYCHEHFVRGSPEGLKVIVRATHANNRKQTDLYPKVSEGQLQHREDDCTQVSIASLSGVHVSSQSPILRKGLKSRRVYEEADTSPRVSSVGCLPSPSQYSVADSILERQVTYQDDFLPFDMMLGQVGISALNEGVPRDEFAEFIDHMIEDLPPNVSEGQLQHREDDCTQVSIASLSGVHVSSQSPILRKGLKSRRVSVDADTSPRVSSVGCLPSPSQYSVVDPILKRRVTFEDDFLPFDTMLGQVGISALNEGVPRDEFAEYIDHMIEDLPPNVSEGQLQHREDDCTQVSIARWAKLASRL